MRRPPLHGPSADGTRRCLCSRHSDVPPPGRCPRPLPRLGSADYGWRAQDERPAEGNGWFRHPDGRIGRPLMKSVQEHYAEHLGPVYSWMAGGCDAALERGGGELETLQLPDSAGALAIDL